MAGNNGWEMDGIAERIRDAVSGALDSCNFDQLNRAISDTVNSALDEARRQFRQRQRQGQVIFDEPDEPGPWRRQADGSFVSGEADGADGSADGLANASDGANAADAASDGYTANAAPDGYAGETARRHARWAAYERAAKSRDGRKGSSLNIRVNWYQQTAGILMSVFGGIGAGIFGMLTIFLFSIFVVMPIGSFGWGLATVILALITAGFGTMLGMGIAKCGRASRLRKYLREIEKEGKPYCELRLLCANGGYDEESVRKDFRKILKSGMLPEVRMDDAGTYLLLNEETYRHYRQAQESLRLREEQERQEQKQGKGYAHAFLSPEVKAAIDKGEGYMAQLDGLRESMPDSEMTEKLVRLDRILERLFGTLKKYPDQLDELERFMDYYLPTTVKLVTAYQEFAAVEFPGDNINRAKREIGETMDTINGAFEKLLDDMYEDTAFDVMTDASVLQTMLAREGLTEGDFRQ